MRRLVVKTHITTGYRRIKFSNLGTVTSGEIITDSEAWGNIFAWKELYDNALSGFLQNREGEGALNMI